MTARGAAILLALLGAAGLLIGVEAMRGAFESRDPPTAVCDQRAPFAGDGTDAAIQRIVLDGIDGAACELGTTRERLVLSFAPETGVDSIPWDSETIDRTVKAGLLEAIAEARDRDDIGGFTELVLRETVERLPVDQIVSGGEWIAGLIR